MSDQDMGKTSTDRIHQNVRKAYTEAVTSPGGGCCGGGGESVRTSTCSGSPTQKGVVARDAGYDPAELAGLPLDAVENSFGCGNPLALSGVREGDVVLDLGSGAGIDLIIAARKVGPTGRVIGVDMTDEMIAHARENVSKSGLTNVEVRKGTIENLPADDASVDQVISNCVINLSPDKPSVFAEIARVLKPGGRMSISDIVVEELPGWMRESAALHSSCVAGAISESAYLQGLHDAGLTDAKVIDRIVYDKTQLRGLVQSEAIPDTPTLSSEKLEEALEAVTGKIWSARFTATR